MSENRLDPNLDPGGSRRSQNAPKCTANADSRPHLRTCDDPFPQDRMVAAIYVCYQPRYEESFAWITARAALWPGIPLTPPPRRAPAPQIHTFGRVVSTPQRPISHSDSA